MTKEAQRIMEALSLALGDNGDPEAILGEVGIELGYPASLEPQDDCTRQVSIESDTDNDGGCTGRVVLSVGRDETVLSVKYAMAIAAHIALAAIEADEREGE